MSSGVEPPRCGGDNHSEDIRTTGLPLRDLTLGHTAYVSLHAASSRDSTSDDRDQDRDQKHDQKHNQNHDFNDDDDHEDNHEHDRQRHKLRQLSQNNDPAAQDDVPPISLQHHASVPHAALPSHFARLTAALMSKTPLILRSSPGLGTGSYGAVPVGVSGTSSDEEDPEDVNWRSRLRRKGSSLSQIVHNGTGSGRSRRAGKEVAGDGAAVGERSIRMRTSHSRLRRKSDLSEASGIEARVGDQGIWAVEEEVGLEGRFAVGGLPVLATDAASDVSKDDVAPLGGASEEAISMEEESTNDEEDPPDNSPYAQVRASVSAIDNTTLSINTPRMWTLSMLFAVLGSSTNLFFSLRYPSVAITPVIALLLVHPMGLLWDKFLKRRDDPDEEFVDGVLSRRTEKGFVADETSSQSSAATNMTGRETTHNLGVKRSSTSRAMRLWLAQGRWNEKEHSCVYISSNVSFGFAFATDVIVEQTHFYNQDVSIIYQLLLILSTQILGYTFAGLTRRFLVKPGGMIWPGTLMSAAMFTTLHKEENKIANGWRITRWKFFFVVWISSFLFYFLPGLLMPALSYFSVITWFAPKNVVIANLFGVASGLGLFPVTFDWAQIAYIGSPLLTPFWAAMNVVGGLVIVMWVVAPIAYYKNVFFSSYMPILSSAVFDNTGQLYDVSKILTKDFLFDREAYSSYSRVFLPITYVLSYGLQFAALASLLTHTACWHGKDIWRQWRRSLKEVEGESKTAYEPIAADVADGSGPRGRRSPGLFKTDSHTDDIIGQEDVHNRLMRRYKDAPMTWYLCTFVSMTAIGMFVVE